MAWGVLRQSVRRTRVVAVRGAGSVLQFALNALLGRVLGPTGTADYFLFSSWVRTFAVPLNLGLPPTVLRDLSVARGSRNHRYARARYLQAVRLTALAGLAAAAALVAWGGSVAAWLGDPDAVELVLLAGAGAWLFALRRVQSEALKAYGQPAFAVALDSVVLATALIAVIWVAVAIDAVTPTVPVVGFIGVSVVLLLVGNLRFASVVRREERTAAPATSTPEPSSGPSWMWGVTAAMVLSTEAPFLVLPRFATLEDIGLFGAAFRLVALATTVTGALAATFGPRFARQFAEGRRTEFRRTLWRSQAASLVLYGPFAALYLLAPAWVLAWFGPGFDAADGILVVLTWAFLVDAGTGLAGQALMMARRERPLLVVTATSLLAFVGLALAFGPARGVQGVAMAFSATLIARSLTVYVLAWIVSRPPTITGRRTA